MITFNWLSFTVPDYKGRDFCELLVGNRCKLDLLHYELSIVDFIKKNAILFKNKTG